MSPIEQIRAAVERVQKFHKAWCDEEPHDPESTGECQIAFWAEHALVLAEALRGHGEWGSIDCDCESCKIGCHLCEALASVAAKVAPK